jgi:hypothetical protein
MHLHLDKASGILYVHFPHKMLKIKYVLAIYPCILHVQTISSSLLQANVTF